MGRQDALQTGHFAYISAAPVKKEGQLGHGGRVRRRQLVEYHECILGKDARPAISDLVAELTREGFGPELEIKGNAQFKTLQAKAEALQSHPRNTGDQFEFCNCGEPERPFDPSSPARAAAILAVMVYTGTEAFSAFNADKRSFYDRSATQKPKPRFPVLDRLLMEARATMPTKWAPDGEGYDGDNLKVTLWSGMHKAYLSLADRKRRKVTLAQDQSMSYDRGVAEFFLANQGKAAKEGTLFRVEVTAKNVGVGGEFGFHWPTADADAFADLTWISKFPDEEEVLVEAGLYLDIVRIEKISDSPKVELVHAVLKDDRAEQNMFWDQF